MKIDEITTTQKTEGTYKNIYCEIIETRTFIGGVSSEKIEWTAGFRGTGKSDTYYDADQSIKECIDSSIKYGDKKKGRSGRSIRIKTE